MTFLCRKDSGKLELLELRDEFTCLINNRSEQPEVSSCFNYPYASPHSSLTYRQTKSISSSSLSSESRSSSECSPLSSPAPSPGDSVASKSDSDTEYELRKMELIMKEGIATPCNASLHSAQVVKSSRQNEHLPPSLVCSPPNHFAPLSKPAIRVQSVPQQIQLASSKNTQNILIQNNVQYVTYTVSQQPNIQQGPVFPNLVTVSARERIAAKLNKRMKDAALLTVAKLKDEELSKGDEHGDT